MANLSFDDIRAKAEQRYDDLTVDGVTFRHPLRLSKTDRKELQNLLSAMENLEDMDSAIETMAQILLLAANSKTAARKLIDRLNPVEMNVLGEEYVKGVQPGEASS